jgi:hypothetical protein
MRTTVEIPDRQRAQLLDLAARRGEKGFSKLVQEAIAVYLDLQRRRDEKVQGALAVLGSFDDEAADRLEASVRELRSQWR